jgi:hypothetical protein
VSSTEAFQRAATLALQVEVPTASVSMMASNPDLAVGEVVSSRIPTRGGE